MQIIKDKQLIENTWTYHADDSELGNGNITISVARLKQQGSGLTQHNGRLGVRIEPDDDITGVVEYLPALSLIELYFPQMADGRLFSYAWLLRNRHGYTGELRATGNFLPDQAFYLSRVGVNAFNPDNIASLPAMLTGLNDFSVKYQPSVY
ncbi:MAG: DUF934 domain-containing protein [Gammaproteobacteria bacterium]|nr:DUF934 domain-containing protein [Gammaproteobacteria bacterium]